MLKQVRHDIKMWDLFDREIFYHRGEEKGNFIRSSVGTGLMLYFMMMMTIAGIPLWSFLFILIPILLPAASMLHPLYGARKDSNWRLTWDLRHEGQYYRTLPKSDKALYPHDILKTITDPDLTEEQCKVLDQKMEKLRYSIEDRNKQRRLAVKKHIDVDSIAQYMDESKASIDIETNTYKELL
jgi:hypothetical protein